MTTAQRTAIAAPATGLKVYDITTNSFWFFNRTIWVEISSSSTGWLIAGNNLTAAGILGSLTNQDVRFFSNNTERMRMLANGQIAVNSTVPILGDRFSSYGISGEYAVNGYALVTGAGVYGQNTANGFGVYGANNSTGQGIIGLNTSATTGRAIEAQNTSPTNTDFSIGAFHFGNGRAGNFQNQLTTNTSITIFGSNNTTQNNSLAAAVWGQSTGIRG